MEQIEIIERSVVESRRPLSSSEALNYVPSSQIQTSREQFVSNGNGYTSQPLPPADDVDRRYLQTGERDAGKEDSYVLYNSGQSLPQQQPRSYSSAGINNYGYDINEVQTSEGGARIVQTHGSGQLVHEEDPSALFSSPSAMHDRSMDTVLQTSGFGRSPGSLYKETISKEVDYRVTTTGGTPPVAGGTPPRLNDSDLSHGSDRLHSILKNADSWKKFPSSDETSLARKDSYRRMQENQPDNGALYPPISQVTTVSTKGSPQRWVYSGNRTRRDTSEDSGNFWNRCRKLFERIVRQIISLFFNSTSRSFLLYPPVCEECLKKNPGMSTYRPPSKLYVQVASPAQVHFELVGNQPFKSNSFTAVDFNTGYIAIADHALTDDNGRHTTCFMMQIDGNALPSMSILKDALDDTYHEVRSQFGWQEYWQYNIEPVDESFVHDKFTDEIDDCEGAKWYFLKHAVYTRDSSCSECYDFCLPDYAVQRRQKYEDNLSLGIRRLNCFRFYVPEWSRFQIAADESGGHWQYPKHSQKNTQRDGDRNWVDWSYPRQQTMSGRPEFDKKL
ncbi:BRICHOS domain-containing protein C09F5.1 [Ditylenchus destructor]|nr:BRICHOS domain-containing protein C09F5.1 [Ditylenchus destructor]